MAKTKIKDWDVAVGAGIKTDKCTDVGQNNQFLSAAQKAVLTGGENADALHWHSGFGAISAQFGRNGLVVAGQYIEANGIPSNVSGIPLANDGQLLSASVAVAAAIVGVDAKIDVMYDAAILATITIPVGFRKGFVTGLSANFAAESEMRCKVTQGQVDKPSVFVEFRWR